MIFKEIDNIRLNFLQVFVKYLKKIRTFLIKIHEGNLNEFSNKKWLQ